MPRSKRPWSKTVTEHGIRIRLFERSGIIYRDVIVNRVVSAKGKARTQHDVRSLGHNDRSLAVDQMKALAEAIARNTLSGKPIRKLTLGQLFTLYLQHRGASLKPTRLREAKARMAMFKDAWGADFNVADVDQTRVNLYVAKRRTLEVIAPSLKPDENGKRRRGFRNPVPPRDGALHGELSWLSACFNWACGFRTNGRPLIAENPMRGVDWPKEKNPRRPIASHARYVATLEHVDAVDSTGRLRCILSLARFTGRREAAICSIHVSDLLFTADRIRSALAAAGLDERDAEHMPHGAIVWRSEADKEGFLFISPMHPAAREAVEIYLRKNPRMGDVPLFPSPTNPQNCIRRETAAKWLIRAESAAAQPKLLGGVFHPYRRLWGTERKHLADVDVAAAGGWRDTRALKLCYQQADAASVLKVVAVGT